jgi:hypothetical protein
MLAMEVIKVVIRSYLLQLDLFVVERSCPAVEIQPLALKQNHQIASLAAGHLDLLVGFVFLAGYSDLSE